MKARRESLFPAVTALVLALAAVGFAVWNSHRSLEAINALIAQRAATRSVRIEIERFLSLFKDVESSVRGFVLTDKADFLIPYNDAIDQIPQVRSALAAALADEQGDNVDWKSVELMIDSRLAIARETIEHNRRGLDRARSTESIEAAKLVMDKIRDAFGQLAEFQDRKLETLNGEMQVLQRTALRLSWISVATALVLVILAVVLVAREQALRRRLEQALRTANVSLERRVNERTAELRTARDAIAEFAGAQDRAIENERRRLSREVHDQIGQVFTAIKLIATTVPREAYPPGQADAMARALDLGIATARRVAAALRPPLLDDLGLAAALKHYIEERAKPNGIVEDITIGDAMSLDRTQALALFRIAQEAITNIVRHAEATRIRIEGSRRNDRYQFRIVDNGKGFAPDTVRAGAMGLVSMRERATLIGATFELSSSRNGVTVEVTVPVAAGNAKCERDAPVAC